MRKTFSIIIAIVMIVALMPAAFATGTGETLFFTSISGETQNPTVGVDFDVYVAVQNKNTTQIVSEGTVTVTFNGTTKTIDTASGTVTFTPTGVTAGSEYEIAISYSGGDTYAANSTTLGVTFSAPVEHDITVSANDAAYGSASASPASAIFGTEIKLTATPASGYSLKEWQTTPSISVADNKFKMPDAAVAVKAVFEPATYAVTLNTNGGTINSGNVTSYTYGTGATLPADVSKAGYTFGGWYDNEACSGTAVTGIGTDATGAKTFYAKWTPIEYNVTLTLNGGTINSGNVTKYSAGTGATLPTDVTKTNYEFGGWYANSDFSGNKVTAISTTEHGNKVFYAKWIPKYTVAFESNGGSAVSSKTVVSGNPVAKPDDPTRSGYAFGGWYSDSALTTAYDFSSTVTSDKTLYAKWNLLYTVKFNSNGGTAVADQSVASGSVATKPADPTFVGYSFSGWYSDNALTTAFNFTTPITADTTLYAKWTVSNNYVTMGKYYGAGLGRAYFSTNGTTWTEVTSTTGVTATVPTGSTVYFKMDPYSGYYRHPYVVNANGSYYSPYIANGIFSVTVNENKVVKLNFSSSVPTGDVSMWQYVVAAFASAGTATGIAVSTKHKKK